MAILNTGKTFTDGENVTAQKLNDIVNNADFAPGSVDNSTIEIHSGGYLKVKPGGIKSEELDTDSVVSVIETALTSEETTASIPTASPPTGNSTGSDGFMSSADKEKLDGIAAGAEVNVQSDWNQSDSAADDFIKNKPTIGPGSTNLSTTANGTSLSVNSDTGNNASIPAATQSAWGAMTDEDKTKLDGIAAGAEVNVQADWNATSGDALILNKPTIGPGATNLSATANGTSLSVNSDTGNNASIPAATQSAWGAMTDEDKTKLDGIAASANNYSHPTGDGNLHVPATGTSNNGKVLTAGSTAGALSWATPPGAYIRAMYDSGWTKFPDPNDPTFDRVRDSAKIYIAHNLNSGYNCNGATNLFGWVWVDGIGGGALQLPGQFQIHGPRQSGGGMVECYGAQITEFSSVAIFLYLGSHGFVDVTSYPSTHRNSTYPSMNATSYSFNGRAIRVILMSFNIACPAT